MRYDRLRALGTHNAEVVERVRERVRASLLADLAASRPPSLDVLVLSGGADWGAFGAGFLHAWSSLPPHDERVMPSFDVVTGISTGALIAPYAFLGDFSRVDSLYRGSRQDWSIRSFIFGALTGHGFYDISILEDVLRDDIREHLVPRLRNADPHRSLLVATSDLDLGMLRMWDLAGEASDPDRLFRIQRAAIAVPGAFDPIVVDGTLNADAGVLKQLFFAPQPRRLRSLLDSWRHEHPEHPARVRYWIILNNRVFEPPTTVQPTWHNTVTRSMAMMLKSGLLAPLTSLWLQVADLSRDGYDVQLRWVGIPSDFPIDESLDMFDPRTTNALSDLGRRFALSADPWRTELPAYTWRDPEEGQFELEASLPPPGPRGLTTGR